MHQVFISYRRGDAKAEARSIFQCLQRAFGDDVPFMDVDSITKGRDFEAALTSSLSGCRAMLVVIGPGWLNSESADGQRRIEDPNDFVAKEVVAALTRAIPVIPVLVNDASMPVPSALPPNLRPLCSRQAAKVSHENFGRDVAAVADSIRPLLTFRPKLMRPVLMGLLVAGVLTIAAMVVVTGSRDRSIRIETTTGADGGRSIEYEL